MIAWIFFSLTLSLKWLQIFERSPEKKKKRLKGRKKEREKRVYFSEELLLG